MIAAIVLAAGESRRMGRQKLVLPYGDKTVIEHIVSQVLTSEIAQTIVVTGHDVQAVEAALLGKPVTFVENPRYKDGMLTSIRAGLQAVTPAAEGFMIVLGDQPSIDAPTIDQLIAGFRAVEKGIVVPLYEDDTGHPIIISMSYRGDVMTKFDDTGLRGLIYGHPEHVHRLPVQAPGVLRDMDTPEDYERELKEIG
ncbi:MAG: molybdopterin-guanine dinucleotide biosynthesis protein MobA [Candidatus Hydrogenedentota bacterium]